MKINVTENKVSIKEEQMLNENEYNIHKIQFDFSSEYTDDLVKVALFSIDNHTYKKIISNSECDIPPEVLTKRGYSILGVYAYKTEQDTLVLRYSPSPTRISVYDGSYKAEAENSEPITPSEIEQYQQILQNSLQQFQNQYNALVEETGGDIQAIEDELQRKVDEGYFDGEDGFSPIANVIQLSNGAKIEIEDKTGRTSASVFNGYSPQRGVDYWTQEDKEEVIEEATQQIEGKIEEYNENAAEKLNQYNQNSVQKTNVYNTNAEQKMSAYNTNASQKVESFNTNANSKLSEYNSNAETKKTAYDENATQKTNSFDTNATNKLTEYNTNHTEKMSAYNSNSIQKLNAFNENATQKTEDFDEHTEEIQDKYNRLAATLPTTGEVTGQAITLNKTAELEFVKPPLPMGNSEQNGTPSPEFESPITNVTGDVEVVVQNKNLFDGNSSNFNASWDGGDANKLTLLADGNIQTTADYSFWRAKAIDIKSLKPNTQYTLSIELISATSTQTNKAVIRIPYNNGTSGGYVDFNGNESLYQFNSLGKKTFTFTTPSDMVHIGLSLNSEGSDTTAVFGNIMIEKGLSATTYVIHQDQTFTFPLGNEKLMLGDYLADDGIHHVRAQDIFDGSEDEVWEKIYGSIENGIALYSVNKNHKQIDGLSDKFIMRNSLSIWYNGEGVTTKWRADKIGFMIDGERINNDYSISAIKSLMNNNPVTVEYELEQEVIVPYTSAQQTAYNQIKQALSYEGQTNISNNQNVIFNVEAYLDTKVILSEKVDKVTGKGLSTNDFTNTYKNSVDSNTSARHTHTNKTVLDGIASSDITNWNGKQNETDNSLNTTNKTITGAINEVYSIARGANQAVSYSNYQAMITAFNSLANDIYNVGQNVMIVTLQVPDLWISGIESTSVPYTYTTDEAFTTELATNGYVQVGYYKLSALETQKVDLTDYEQNTNKTTTISSSSTNAQYPSAKAVYDLFNSIIDGDEVSY